MLIHPNRTTMRSDKKYSKNSLFGIRSFTFIFIPYSIIFYYGTTQHPFQESLDSYTALKCFSLSSNISNLLARNFKTVKLDISGLLSYSQRPSIGIEEMVDFRNSSSPNLLIYSNIGQYPDQKQITSDSNLKIVFSIPYSQTSSWIKVY